MPTLNWFRADGPITRTSFPRLAVWRQDRGLWRVLATDDDNDTNVTGPPYVTKVEAHVAVATAPELEDWRAAD